MLTVYGYISFYLSFTGMCEFPGHSQLFMKNSDMQVTATQDLSKTTPSTFLDNFSICLNAPPTY